jgi:hypothetical protein
MSVRSAAHALWIAALERSPVRGLVVRDSRFSGVRKGSHLVGVGEMELENVTMDAAPGKEVRP